MSSAPETTTARELAERLGFKPHYGHQLVKDGRFVLAPDGKRVLVAESLARYQATKDPSKQGVADWHVKARQGGGGDSDKPPATHAGEFDDVPMYDFHNAKAKREHWAAEREHALWRKEAGELMERSEVVAMMADAGATIRGKLEAWSAALPPQLTGRDEAAIRATIADQVERLLSDLVEKFQKMAEAGQ